jgi:D-alanine-D-alanine ligase
MSCLKIGLVFETFETYPLRAGDPPDAQVEYEPESTIEALEAAIRELGHRPERLGSPHDLLERLSRAPGSVSALGVDAVFNLAEGVGGRNREGWAPTLLEMAGLPCLGSDALTLSLTLDKAWANRFVAAAGVPVAPQTTFESGAAARVGALPADFPLFVKPRWEGTAKGIRATSRVLDRDALVTEVERITRTYAQPALVEAFVPGPEYTVTLIGNDPVEALPMVQRALDRETGIGLHALEGPGNARVSREPEISGGLDPELETELARWAKQVFEVFECRDFARVDFRLDASGRAVFLEINPLPTFATDGTFAILAELEGVSLSRMLGRCLEAGLVRLGLGV